jgi:hypothetical protein
MNGAPQPGEQMRAPLRLTKLTLRQRERSERFNTTSMSAPSVGNWHA